MVVFFRYWQFTLFLNLMNFIFWIFLSSPVMFFNLLFMSSLSPIIFFVPLKDFFEDFHFDYNFFLLHNIIFVPTKSRHSVGAALKTALQQTYSNRIDLCNKMNLVNLGYLSSIHQLKGNDMFHSHWNQL